YETVATPALAPGPGQARVARPYPEFIRHLQATFFHKHYNSRMRTVLPGALPEPREAGVLAAYLTKTAPNLVRWMARARHRELPADPAATGCMPHEYWQLLAQGFQPGPDQNFATGLGPLRAGTQPSPEEPVWLAELVHVAPSRD